MQKTRNSLKITALGVTNIYEQIVIFKIKC